MEYNECTHDAYSSPVFRSVRASSSISSTNALARLPASVGVGEAASILMAAAAGGNGCATGDETGIEIDAEGTTPSSAADAGLLGLVRAMIEMGGRLESEKMQVSSSLQVEAGGTH